MKDEKENTVEVTKPIVNLNQADKPLAFDKSGDKLIDKTTSQTVKSLTSLISLGDTGASCHWVDGEIFCD